MKKQLKIKAPLPIPEQLNMQVQAACITQVKRHGQPDFVSLDDMASYIIATLEDIQAITQQDYACFADDFFIEVEHLLDARFYGVTYSAPTMRRTSRSSGSGTSGYEAPLTLTSAQEKELEKYDGLIWATINRVITSAALDPAVGRDDLHIAGQIALVRALQTRRNDMNFRSYAITMIRSALMNTIAESVSSSKSYSGSVSFEAMMDADDETCHQKLPSRFITDSVKDAFEEQEILEVLFTESKNYKPGSAIWKGIMVIAEIAKGKSLTEVSKAWNVEPGLLSAWRAKARQALFRSEGFMTAIGREDDYRRIMAEAAAKKRKKVAGSDEDSAT